METSEFKYSARPEWPGLLHVYRHVPGTSLKTREVRTVAGTAKERFEHDMALVLRLLDVPQAARDACVQAIYAKAFQAGH